MRTLYTIFALILSIHLVHSQTQIGSDLEGFLPDDDFGYSVSISDDGQRVAIGAPGHITGQDAGYVQIFQKTDSDWEQLGSIITGKLPYNNAGARVALSGDGQRLMLGAIYNNNGERSGSVIVYEFNGTDWVQMGLELGAISNLTSVGQAIAISENGNVIAFTTTIVTSISEITGRVVAYEWKDNAWQKRGVTFNPTQTFDLYGYSLDLSDDGSRLAIGASNGVSPATGASDGFAQIYQYQSDQWQQLGSNIYGNYSVGSFGSDVTLAGDGNRIIVSGPAIIDDLIFTGTVRAFDFNGIDWQMVGDELIGGESFDDFGDGLKASKDGNSFVYGANSDDDGKGCAALYKLVDNKWEMELEKVCGDVDRDQLGFSVDISADGLTVVTGARVNENAEVKSGFARVWDYKINTKNETLKNKNFMIYPNPANDRIFVDLPKDMTTHARIYNVQQQLMMETSLDQNNQIDIQALENGIYFIQCNRGSEIFVSKFVKN